MTLFTLNNDCSGNPAQVVALTTAQAAAITAAPATVLTFLQFMALFTATEQAAIVNSTDPQIRLFTLMAAGAGTIILSNPEVVAGVNYLVTPAGILTSGNAALILSGLPSA